MTACFFPGQGSQVKGVGATLFSKFPELEAVADHILGYSIKKLCLEDPKQQLFQTEYTQPALYVVNALSYMKWLQSHQIPNYVLGHSLGEYNALLAAGVFDFATGLRLVQKRGQLMQQVSGGGMAAVIGLSVDVVVEILAKTHPSLTIANYNSPTQTIITGPKAAIDGASTSFEQAGAIYLPLKVSGAFHSSYLAPVKKEFKEFSLQFQYANPEIAVIANLTAKPYQQGEVPAHLSAHMVNPVLWSKSIQYLLNQGEQDFNEIGPGTVLTRLLTANRQGR